MPERQRLLEACDRSVGRRLLLVVAEAGFGKTTLVRRWTQGRRTAWYTVTERDRRLGSFAHGLIEAVVACWPHAALGAPAMDPADESDLDRSLAVATALGESLREGAEPGGVLVLDDLHLLDDAGASWQLVEALLGALPEQLTLVVLGRTDLPFRVDRLRGQGQVVDVTAADLAFTGGEIRQLLAAELPESLDLADQVEDVAAGWPAATRLAVERLRHEPPDRRPATLSGLAHHGVVLDYLAAEVVDRETAPVRALLGAVSVLPWFTVAMCHDLGLADPGMVGSLLRRGVLLERHQPHSEALAPIAPIRALVRTRLDLGPARRAETVRRAAAWYADNGSTAVALSALAGLPDPGPAYDLVVARGAELVAAGGVYAVLEVVDHLDRGRRPAEVDAVEGEARLVVGHWDEALACYGRILAGGGPARPDVAWRVAMAHYLRGDLDAALAVCESVGDPVDADLADLARVAAWHATALWVRGHLDRSQPLADRSLALAERSGSDAAQATAHTVLAMHAAVAGDATASAAHSEDALRAAAHAGDALQTIRIRVNRASHVADEGHYERALAELEPALALADLTGFANFHALALSNRGEVLRSLGRLDEATRDLEEAVRRYRGLGSTALSYPLGHLADVLRMRGERTMAIATYHEALQLADRGGDQQASRPAQEGLARTLVVTDPDAAEEALAGVASGPTVRALLAAATGDRARAAELAREALDHAADRGERPVLAEALWLSGACDRDEQRLREAAALYDAMGDPLGAARCDLARCRLRGVDDGPPAGRLRAAGAAGVLAETDLVVPPGLATAGAGVRVEAMGQFRVLRAGSPVPLSSWQSRKARDLLKILVARRGVLLTRDELVDLLWPDTDAARARPRLSVALRTVRSVLDPDGSERFDHYVRGDARAVWLDVERVEVDLVGFHAAVEAGLAAVDEHRLDEAIEAYGGDFCPEDLYEDWADEPRALARNRLLDALRTRARLAGHGGDRERAVACLYRCVSLEPYDEASTLTLVELLTGLGRHGDARRVYRDYAARMFELGVEATPFPA